MAVGDVYQYQDGRPYIETEGGPCITWECYDCGAPAAAAFEYIGRVRCGGCWSVHHGLGQRTTPAPTGDSTSSG